MSSSAPSSNWKTSQRVRRRTADVNSGFNVGRYQQPPSSSTTNTNTMTPPGSGNLHAGNGNSSLFETTSNSNNNGNSSMMGGGSELHQQQQQQVIDDGASECGLTEILENAFDHNHAPRPLPSLVERKNSSRQGSIHSVSENGVFDSMPPIGGGVGGSMRQKTRRRNSGTTGGILSSPDSGGVSVEDLAGKEEENGSLLDSIQSFGPNLGGAFASIQISGNDADDDDDDGRTQRSNSKNPFSHHHRRGVTSLFQRCQRTLLEHDRKLSQNARPGGRWNKVIRLLYLCGIVSVIMMTINVASSGQYGHGQAIKRMIARRKERRRAKKDHRKRQQILNRMQGGSPSSSGVAVVTGGGGGSAGAGGGGGVDGGIIEPLGVPIPSAFDNIVELNYSDQQPQQQFAPSSEVPFYWHISRSGGTTLRDILTFCFHLTLAGGYGEPPVEKSGDKLEIITMTEGPYKSAKYLNVNTYTDEGIDKAQRLGLINSGLPFHVIFSRSPHSISSKLFASPPAKKKGRMFTILRHPIQRAASLFYYTQNTVWRRRKVADLADITIVEYFKSGSGENNWLVRYLADVMDRELTEDDLSVAKEILRRKVLIGLLEEKGETMSRFERTFGWTFQEGNDGQCHEKTLQWSWPNKHRHEPVEEGTELWGLILKQNGFDMRLYDYAVDLFREQGDRFFRGI